MGWSTTVVAPPDGHMGDYMSSLEAIASRGFSTLWPTHGPPVTDVAPFLAAYAEHRRDRERQILAQLQAGHGKIKDMVEQMYADVDPRLHPAACQSVLAHIIELVRDGRVATDGAPKTDSDYRLS
jgi:glyoxylase-like metal-dependent hydrolase (beta-lactamase superfamily II)